MKINLIGINYKGAPVVLSTHDSRDLYVTRHCDDGHIMLRDRSRLHPRTGNPIVVAYRSKFSILSVWTHTDRCGIEADFSSIYCEAA